mmetsp:Transcript_53994/g.97220  ORF Transcript_53994/g.97220 Transcript_53994/m.97220 type:complete len:293 (-) Transcript_53994:489-1367(-)
MHDAENKSSERSLVSQANFRHAACIRQRGSAFCLPNLVWVYPATILCIGLHEGQARLPPRKIGHAAVQKQGRHSPTFQHGSTQLIHLNRCTSPASSVDTVHEVLKRVEAAVVELRWSADEFLQLCPHNCERLGQVGEQKIYQARCPREADSSHRETGWRHRLRLLCHSCGEHRAAVEVERELFHVAGAVQEVGKEADAHVGLRMQHNCLHHLPGLLMNYALHSVLPPDELLHDRVQRSSPLVCLVSSLVVQALCRVDLMHNCPELLQTQAFAIVSVFRRALAGISRRLVSHF